MMKKHGFDLISFPFTVWAIEPEGYDGSLGGGFMVKVRVVGLTLGISSKLLTR